MTAAAAFRRVIELGPFDDPDVSWYPVRWYFALDGVLCRCAWRGVPVRFPEWVRPQ